VRCSVLQYIAVCCNVLQCVAVRCLLVPYDEERVAGSESALQCVLQCVAVRCIVLQCAEVCCSAVCCSVMLNDTVRYGENGW